MANPCRSIFLFFLAALLFATSSLAYAQGEEIPAPEFLYRDENKLILINGYTGESVELLTDLEERDKFTWSPDGLYLLAFRQDGYGFRYCINLFEVDVREWKYTEPIACGVESALFSRDSKTIIYASSDDYTATLWRFELEDESKQELYRQEGDRIHSVGLSDIRWSPEEKYLTFGHYYWIVGGTINSFVVMDAETFNYVVVAAPDPYYAYYEPVWSADDEWFLIILKEEYVYTGSMPFSNHKGDVYLVNSQTGEQVRLTYTPAVLETDIHWTETGDIAFTEIIEETHVYTLEEAQNIAVVSDEDIVMPEDVDTETYYGTSSDVMVSPDPHVRARFSIGVAGRAEQVYELIIEKFYGDSTEEITIYLSDNYKLFGWRPSDYPYPNG